VRIKLLQNNFESDHDDDKSWDDRVNSPKSGVSFFCSCPHGGRGNYVGGFFSCPHGVENILKGFYVYFDLNFTFISISALRSFRPQHERTYVAGSEAAAAKPLGGVLGGGGGPPA
jgi:hypothetical protein